MVMQISEKIPIRKRDRYPIERKYTSEEGKQTLQINKRITRANDPIE